jgi:hypothetical protein
MLVPMVVIIIVVVVRHAGQSGEVLASCEGSAGDRRPISCDAGGVLEGSSP